MAAYDYRCRVCDAAFEVRRSIAAPETVVSCPSGHAEVTRVWTAVALAGVGGGAAGRVAERSAAAPAASGGGCCGGGCCG